MAKPIAYYDPSRQLARIEKIDAIVPIPKADRLELAIIGGWEVIVGKNQYKEGEKILYCEVNSLLPVSVPEFFGAARDGNVKTFGEDYAYIKTFKLRGAIGQGYVCPIPEEHKNKPVGTDLTAALGVLKYDPNPSEDVLVLAKPRTERKKSWIEKVIGFISGAPVGNLLPFPEEHLPKSGETRIQNSMRALSQITEETDGAELTFKFDGSSMTILSALDENNELQQRLCTHNCEISLVPIHVGFWKALRLFLGGTLSAIHNRFKGAPKFYFPKFQRVIPVWNGNFTRMYYALMSKGLNERLKAHYEATGEALSFQGELVGPSVVAGDRENYEGLRKDAFYVYYVYRNGVQLPPREARKVTAELLLDYMPVFDDNFKVLDYTVAINDGSGRRMVNIKQLTELAKGPRYFTKDGVREGFVIKFHNVRLSAKIINPDFLLQNGDA